MAVLQAEVEILHFEHTLWRNELNFVEDELRIFERQLEKLVTTLTNRDMLAKLEHYQNQFIRQKEVLDQLQHDIKVHEQALANLLKSGGEIDETDSQRHAIAAEKLAIFRKIYQELKGEFFQFMAENL